MSLTSGSNVAANTQIAAATADVSVHAGGDIQATAGSGNNTFATVQSGAALVLESTNGNISFAGGSGNGAYALATTTGGGDITVSALNGAVSFIGGSAASGNTQANIIAETGGNIAFNAENLYLYEGTGLNAKANVKTGSNASSGNITAALTGTLQTNGATISTGILGGAITLEAAGDLNFQSTNMATLSRSASSPITLTAGSGGDIDFSGTSVTTNLGNVAMTAGGSISYAHTTFNLAVPADGSFSAIAGDNLSFDTNSFVHVSGPDLPLVQLVVDNNNPASVGSGSFVYPIGANITAFGSSFVRIYTAARANNTVATGAVIDGLVYVPSTPAGTDTNQEVWDTFYPTVPAAPEDGSDHFTIYYKSLNDYPKSFSLSNPTAPAATPQALFFLP